MPKAMPQMMGLVSAEAIAEAKAVEQAAQAAREAQAVEWFREWHALLQRGLLSAQQSEARTWDDRREARHGRQMSPLATAHAGRGRRRRRWRWR